MTPLISIVTGTYNRIESLGKMVESVRVSLATALSYEIIVVDGGSTDGTQAWCQAQPDITLIRHAELLGAIRAFDDGANAATGDYLVMANDDIVFNGDSLVRALVFLETHPTCGGVAFADNRPANGYPPGYKVQVMRGINADGQPIPLPYAQVGMFRRWLAKEAGFWGSTDPIMAKALTYGGDNYLSSRIIEVGYTINAVEGVSVHDSVARDNLRAHNIAEELKRSATVKGGSFYYERYPNGVTPASLPMPANPQTERLRILYLPIYEPGFGHYKRGLREALQEIGLVYELDYLNVAFDLPAIVAAFQPHLMLTQFHGANVVGADLLHAARRACPSMVVANWNGDIYLEALTSPEMLALLRHVDVQLTVNADALPIYAREGIHAAYWQIAAEPVSDVLPDVPAYDIVFLANCYSEKRHALGAFLRSLPYKVGIYGRGWDDADGDCLYDFDTAAALYKNAKIAIGDNQYGDKAYVSNRLFEALHHGAFLLHQRIADFDTYTGIRAGVHYATWGELDDLRVKLDHYLNDENAHTRNKIAKAGMRRIYEQHTFRARVRTLFTEILPQLQIEKVEAA